MTDATRAENGDRRPVLVGVDGSEAGAAAVDLGIAEARRHGRPLRLVHAFVWPLLPGIPLGPAPGAPPDAGLTADAYRVLEEAEQRVAAASELAVEGEVIIGDVVPVLLAEAADAALVVIGDRGLGGISGLLIGSVAVQLAGHTPVPLLVARGTPDRTGPVVVGVDGSPAGAAAVDFAFAEAAARRAPVRAVTAWSARLSPHVEERLPLIYQTEDVAAAQARLLSEAVTEARARYPEVAVDEEIRHQRAGKALVEMSADAQLVVVGARGRGGFLGLLLGSVSQAVLHHAQCPVAVVRQPEDS